MKRFIKFLYVALLSSIVFLACKESNTGVDFAEPTVLVKDTTYLTGNLPQGVLKNVLIDEVSGVRCQSCPNAAKSAHDIQEQYGKDRIVILTLHPTMYTTLTKPFPNGESKDTLNREISSEIADKLIGNIGSLPAGAIDRKIYEGKTQVNNAKHETWGTYVKTQMNSKPVVELKLDIRPTVDRDYVANIKTTFLEKFDESVHLSVFLIESGIISKQSTTKDTIGYDINYEHNAVLRKGFTPYNGIELAKNVEVGRVFEKGFEITIPEKYKIENCAIVALVSRSGAESSEVFQCAEAAVI